MKLTALAGASLLVLGSAAFAQDMSQETQGPADSAAPATTMESEPAAPAEALPAEPMPADSALPAEAAPAPEAAMPADEMAPTEPAPAATETAFTDAEVESFAAAALEIQSLEGDEATKATQAATIVAESGIDAETFNAIGAAMQTDPALAERIQLAAAGLQAQPEG